MTDVETLVSPGVPSNVLVVGLQLVEAVPPTTVPTPAETLNVALGANHALKAAVVGVLE